jgi:hypothetical protein
VRNGCQPLTWSIALVCLEATRQAVTDCG